MLDVCLRLLHPFTPFVTEELWGHLRKACAGLTLADLVKDWPEALIVPSWPEPRAEEDWEAAKLADFSLIQEGIRSIRNVRAEKGVKPSKKIPATFITGDRHPLFTEMAGVITALAGTDADQTRSSKTVDEKPAEFHPSGHRYDRDLPSAGWPGRSG